jgi:hypothetical protein
MYDASGGGKELRTVAYNGLAYWHTMKIAFFKIYEAFANEFITASFHHLYPAFIFYAKPSYLSSIMVHLTYIRLAYASFRPYLVAALASGNLSFGQKVHLLNLRDLCEYFIPVVICILLVAFDMMGVTAQNTHLFSKNYSTIIKFNFGEKENLENYSMCAKSARALTCEQSVFTFRVVLRMFTSRPTFLSPTITLCSSRLRY